VASNLRIPEEKKAYLVNSSSKITGLSDSSSVFLVNNVYIFRSLLSLPVIHGYSWGEGSLNMSENYSDISLVKERVREFLATLGINKTTPIVKINPVNKGSSDPDIMEITKDILKREVTDAGEIEVFGNSIYTKIKEVALVIKPADCAICVYYFECKQGKYVGLIHCSAKETDKLIAKQTIRHLKNKYGIDPSEIKMGITPAISKEFYSVKNDEINIKNWEGFAVIKGEEIYLDIVGNVLHQLIEEGLRREKIEIINEDTFTSALEGKTFSHHMSEQLGLPNGRFIVAVCLK
jgi:copper oxidase (laccase) domain-containing protein